MGCAVSLGGAGAPTPAAQDDLVLAHLESAQSLDPFHVQGVPRHVYHRLRCLVDEVVMRLELRVEAHAPLRELELPEQPGAPQAERPRCLPGPLQRALLRRLSVQQARAEAP